MLRIFGVASACLFQVGSAWAGPSFKPSDAPVIQVEQLDPDTDMSAFSAPGYEVHRPDSELKGSHAIPSPKKRDQIFAASGVQSDVRDWDAVDRDVLFLRAKSLTLEQLQARYPKIKPDTLHKLKQTIESDRP